MCVTGQNVFLVGRILIRRKGFVQTFCNVLYNYECDKKDSCPDSTYDGQSSKNLYTRSLNHDYKNDKKHKDSFMHLHQEKSHNNENEKFKLSVTRFYRNDRLSCEIAEAVILRQRTGEILNMKSEFHNPPIVKVTRNIQRGLIWPEAVIIFVNSVFLVRTLAHPCKKFS